ncbi:hypothetical protein RMATCC62417_18312 [Rhizopus microsporus]|nr:hypothetical protein RMATCC62417_18312 [Rhizopus microsporus]
MKIACCQFDPKWGDAYGNMRTANVMLKDYTSSDIDVLVLPEMAFTGYVFNSVEEIMPYLEDAETGPTVNWARKQAQRLECYVIVGYPQKEGNRYYNSLCCVDPQGKLVKTYQKSFLFETDEQWATEGPGFVSMEIDGLGKVGFGICMDINPYQLKADFHDHEFANYHLKHDTDIIFCCMAWLKNSGDERDMIKYWAFRLLPLHSDSANERHTYFIACNRTGVERGKRFAGTSCALDISNKNFTILDYMGCDTTGVMITEILR